MAPPTMSDDEHIRIPHVGAILAAGILRLQKGRRIADTTQASLLNNSRESSGSGLESPAKSVLSVHTG